MHNQATPELQNSKNQPNFKQGFVLTTQGPEIQ
jgi:hypothetical protein